MNRTIDNAISERLEALNIVNPTDDQKKKVREEIEARLESIIKELGILTRLHNYYEDSDGHLLFMALDGWFVWWGECQAWACLGPMPMLMEKLQVEELKSRSIDSVAAEGRLVKNTEITAKVDTDYTWLVIYPEDLPSFLRCPVTATVSSGHNQ